jgi:hypothetical protein
MEAPMKLCMHGWVISIAVATLVACEEEPLVVVPAQIPEAERAAAAAAVARQATPALGKIQAVSGSATLVRDGEKTEVAVGAAARAGDRVETGDDGGARLEVEADGTLLAIGRNSSMVVGAFDAGETGRTGSLQFPSGRFWVQVSDAPNGDTSIEIDTPNATVRAGRATFFGDVAKDLICALDGELQVVSKNAKKKKKLTLKKGQCASKLSKAKAKKTRAKPKQAKKILAEIEIPAASE